MFALRAVVIYLWALLILAVVDLSQQQGFGGSNQGNPWLQMWRAYQQYQMRFGGFGDDGPFGFDD